MDKKTIVIPLLCPGKMMGDRCRNFIELQYSIKVSGAVSPDLAGYAGSCSKCGTEAELVIKLGTK